eukprot:GHVU01171391.1.p1 GENE.GHVU01171391.1~~GHVU01171391.1.p1  ORF type:complete len:168 (-),score=14.57 GHVU01171391.1:90-593(-)
MEGRSSPMGFAAYMSLPTLICTLCALIAVQQQTPNLYAMPIILRLHPCLPSRRSPEQLEVHNNSRTEQARVSEYFLTPMKVAYVSLEAGVHWAIRRYDESRRRMGTRPQQQDEQIGKIKTKGVQKGPLPNPAIQSRGVSSLNEVSNNMPRRESGSGSSQATEETRQL